MGTSQCSAQVQLSRGRTAHCTEDAVPWPLPMCVVAAARSLEHVLILASSERSPYPSAEGEPRLPKVRRVMTKTGGVPKS